MSSKITINGIDSAGEWTPLYTVPQSAPDALREAARMALEAADSVVSQLSALHRATMGYEDACVLRGAELVADALREALGDEK